MHYVFIPAPVVLRNLETGEPLHRTSEKAEPGMSPKVDSLGNTFYIGPDTPWSMWRMLARWVLGNPKLGKGRQGALRGKRLRRVFEKAQPLTWVPVDSELVEAVRHVFEDPTGQGVPEWNSAFTSQLTDFFDAFQEACERKPADTIVPPWYEGDVGPTGQPPATTAASANGGEHA